MLPLRTLFHCQNLPVLHCLLGRLEFLSGVCLPANELTPLFDPVLLRQVRAPTQVGYLLDVSLSF